MGKHGSWTKGKAYTPEAFPGYKCMSSKRPAGSGHTHGSTEHGGKPNKAMTVNKMSGKHGCTTGQSDHPNSHNSYGKAKPYNCLTETTGGMKKWKKNQ